MKLCGVNRRRTKMRLCYIEESEMGVMVEDEFMTPL
jgi:hypothetical protein